MTGSGPWGALVLDVPGGREDEWIALLAAGSLGARVRATRSGASRLEIFLASTADADRALDRALMLLGRAGLDPRSCKLRTVEVPDGAWVETYRAGLRPFRLGRRFVVQPGDRKPSAGEGDPIVLVPGRAFGTGEHPTTQLCVRQLERLVRPGSRWVDLGCGTGILALVAARCGAASVLALDDDPEAVQVAREVLRANRVEAGTSVREGSVEQVEPGVWDGVVCNIGARFFIDRAAALAALLRAGGRVVAAGFLAEDLSRVRRSLVEAGLEEANRDEASPWSVLVMGRS